MSPLSIASGLFSLLSSIGESSGSSSSSSASSATRNSIVSGGDFSSSLALRMAALQSQPVSSLTGSGNASGLSFLGSTSGPFSGLSPFGRNLSLFDPESGYRMMSNINARDANYKAQYWEVGEMQSALAGMQQAGNALAVSGRSGDVASLKADAEAFVQKYNDWVGRFEQTTRTGGVLSGTQAAEVSLYELRQSVESRFNGASAGVRGLSDLGITIDPVTHAASLDSAKFDAAVTGNLAGVRAAFGEFGDNFARSAGLLISANNFIPNRLGNLDRAIHYIQDNKTSLQTEFGLGEAPRLSKQVQQALSSYNAMFKT